MVNAANPANPVTVTLRGWHLTQLQAFDTDDLPDRLWWVGLALLWLRARLAVGFTAASSIGVEIVG